MTNRRMVTLGVMLGIFLAGIEGTVVSTAMPTIVSSLGGLQLYSWVFASYMLLAAVSMPVFGKLSDQYGRRRTFFVGVALFVTGSVASGLSQNIHQLIAARAFQGLGGGAMFALPYTILGVVYPPEERGRAIGYGSAVWGISSVIGPMAGYAIVETLGWRWVFFLSVPFGAASIATLALYMEESVGEASKENDLLGAATLAVGAGSALLGLQLTESGDPRAPYLILLGLAGLASFYFVERRAVEPLIDPELFHDAVYVATNSAAFLSSAAIFGALTYAPLFLQGVRGGTGSAALAVFPIAVGWSFTSMATGRVVNRVGERRLVLAGNGIMAAGFLAGTVWKAETPLHLLGINLFAMGVGMGMMTPPLLTAIQNHLGAGRMGVATSSQQFFRNVGGTTGVVALGLVMVSSMESGLRGTEGISSLGDLQSATLGGSAPTGLASVMAEGIVSVYTVALLVSLLTAVSAYFVPVSSTGDS